MAEVFAKQIVDSVARLWLGQEAGQEVADESLLLLAELCALLQPSVGVSRNLTIERSL